MEVWEMKTLKKMLFIVNPRSGKNQIKPYLCDIIDMYVADGFEVTVHTTQRKGDAYETVKDCGGRYDMIACSGGDGTLDEVGAGVLELEHAPAIGYIPAGTTNDYARTLGLSAMPLEAARTVIDGIPFACDAGRLNGKPFVYVAAFGIFTEVSYTTPQEAKNTLGHAAYVMEGIKSLMKVKSCHIRCEYDGHCLEDDFIYGMITNSVSVGGFKFLSGKVTLLDDGLFEVLLLKMPKNLLDLQALVGNLLLQNVDERFVHLIKTDRIKLSSDEEISWTLDGEDGGKCRQAEIINLKQAITIMRPRDAVERRLVGEDAAERRLVEKDAVERDGSSDLSEQ